MPPAEAVIVQVPAATPVAIPLASTVHTAGSLEAQLTKPDTLPVVVSENAPVAVNVVVLPFAIDMVTGAIVNPVRVDDVTVMVPFAEVVPPYVVPLFNEAVITVAPTALPVTTPVLGVTLAMPEAAVVHVTEVVRSAVVPFA